MIVWWLDRPARWEGQVLTEPRTQLTVAQLIAGEPLPLLDMSFFARPDWALIAQPLSGLISFSTAQMVFPKNRDPYLEEDLFPKLKMEFVSHDQKLIRASKGVIDTRSESDSGM